MSNKKTKTFTEEAVAITATAVTMGCLMLVVLSLIYSIVGCWLWGIIAVGIFNLPALSFWQFFGLQVLIRTFMPIRVANSSTGGCGGNKR